MGSNQCLCVACDCDEDLYRDICPMCEVKKLRKQRAERAAVEAKLMKGCQIALAYLDSKGGDTGGVRGFLSATLREAELNP